MKATGIVRKIDGLGRVVIPMEMRKTMDLPEGTALEIFVNGNQIVLRRYEPGCVFCGSMTDVKVIREKLICTSCVSEIAESRGVHA
ncbi:AbrB/MazE/SpoVT family DNA-binding domain-containing protein [Cohnella panacarvi]|uniref:AbrB/MazE/SpoVT family DNA-binding domain-containing protein n=1 Tax=Cohnella panacarvi TaxID=400776 RepID=UPI00047B3164|nr:AbrB/MazE/SpoVT family DNA-binding domain-containing protein [Cohnella panacarvi]